MSKLASGQRSGLARPSQLCTSCLLAWSAQLQPQRSLWAHNSAAVTATSSQRHYVTATPAAAAKSSQPSTKRSRPSSTKRARATKSASTSQGGQTQLKLWRETLDVLKKLEAVQERLAEQGQEANGGSSKSESLSGGGGGGGGDGSSSSPKKKQAASAATKESKTDSAQDAAAVVADAAIDAENKEGAEQVKMLTSALHLLKTVLSTQGFQQQQQQQREEEVDSTTTDGGSSETADTKPNRAARRKALKKKGLAETAPSEGGDDKQRPISKGGAGAGGKKKGEASAAATTTMATTGAEKPADQGKPFSSLTQPLKSPYRVNRVNSKHLSLTPVEEEVRPVPGLHYGLDRALFNPGVYHLQDPRSRVYNFDPYLAKIMPIREFDFNALKQYVTSSKDSTLISIAAKLKKKYSGSTSSMTSMLSHFHFLLSGWRPINTAHMSRSFTPESLNYTRITKAPAATFLHLKDGTYAIDADKEFDTANILSMLGKSMEKLLTLSKDDFEKYRVSKSHELTEEERNDPESFHYTTFGDFLMRSQLDAYDERLPGSGMFDLKTRAVVSIRMDTQDFQQGLGYEIRQRFGQWESFEREYFDMIRSAFLKYSLQVRMGRMDGIYVAFHNTRRIFGFQYISINEMDLALHGTDDRTLGDREFMLSLNMLNAVLDRATERFPGRSLRLHIETRPSEVAPFMYIFAKPVEPEEIEEVQTANKASIDEFEQRMLGIVTDDKAADGTKGQENNAITSGADVSLAVDYEEREVWAEKQEGREEEVEEQEKEQEEEEDEDEEEEEGEDDVDSQSFDVWESMRQKVEETMENETLGIASVRDTIEDALELSGLLRGRSPEETRGYVDALLDAITQPDTEMVAESILNEGEKGKEAGSDVEAEIEAETEAEAQAESRIQAVAEAEDGGASGLRLSGDDKAAGEAKDGADENSTAATSSSSSEEPASIEPESEVVQKEAAAEETIEEAAEAAQDADDTAIHRVAAAPTSVDSNDKQASRVSDTISLRDVIIKLAAQVEASQTAGGDVVEDEGQQQQQQDDDDTAVVAGVEGVDGYKNKRFERILTEMMARPKKAGKGKETKKAEGDSKSASFEASGSTSSSSASSSSASSSATTGAAAPEEEVMGMILTLRNKVNGRYVARPERMDSKDSWVVEYAIEEMKPAQRTHSLYELLQKRRRGLLGPRPKPTAFDRDFMARLRALSSKGRQFRKAENKQAQKHPVQVYGVDEKLKWEDVFSEEED